MKTFKAGIVTALFIILSVFLPARAINSDNPNEIAKKFFTLVYSGEYREAYARFSAGVKHEVSYSRFVSGAKDVKYFKMLDIKVIDREENLIKMKMSAVVHLYYKGSLYEAVYEGLVSLYKESGTWKVETIDLEAKSQKPLGKSKVNNRVRKLDFGTK